MTGPSREPAHRIARYQVVAAASVTAIALLILAVALGRSDARLAGTDLVRLSKPVVIVAPGHPVCQTNLLIPKGTAGVRPLVGAPGGPGPALTVTVKADRLTRVGAASGYPDGGRPTLAFSEIPSTTVAEVCFSVAGRQVTLGGADGAPPGQVSQLLAGSKARSAGITMDFVRPGSERLGSIVPVMFHRAALFKAGWIGAWTYWALALLLLSGGAGAVWLLTRYTRSAPRARNAAAAVTTIAFINALAWSLITPMFGAPDEAAHFAYVESIALQGERPVADPANTQPAFTHGTNTLWGVLGSPVIRDVAGKPPWTDRQRDAVNDAYNRIDDPDGGGAGYTAAAGYSPVYYTLEAGPYLLASSSSPFTQLWLARLLSVLMMALTALLTFLFVRELVPSVAWAGAAAGLGVAFVPMLGSIGGALNNDNLLVLCATGELYLLARALHRGIDWKLASTIGLVLGAGILVKPSMFALVPVAALTLTYVAFNNPDRRLGFRSAAVAAGALLISLAVRYVVFGKDQALSNVSDTTSQSGFEFSVRDLVAYSWQWYLPRPPFLRPDFFPGGIPAYEIYLKGFWGVFGNLDTRFPAEAFKWIAAGCATLGALAAVAVYRARKNLGELVPAILLCVGGLAAFAMMVTVVSYGELVRHGGQFAQGRYLLPAVGVFGASVVAASLAFGRRLGLVAATAIVVAVAWLQVFSLGLTMTRYYS